MADLTDLLEKMKESNSLELIRDRVKGAIDKRQEKNELAQLNALDSLEASFPKAFVEKAEVLVGEKRLFEHTELLGDIKRGVDGISLTFGQRFKDFFTNFGGLVPSRAARKRSEAADLAQSLIQADTRMIARAIGEGNERAAIELKEKKKQFFGLRGVAMGISSLAKGVGGLFGKKTGGAAGAEKAKEAIQHRDKMGRFAKRTAEGVEDLNKTFLQSLKEKAKIGLGAIVAIGMAVLVAFFSEIAKQIRWMKKFTGAKFGKLFAPIKNFFSKGFTTVGDEIKKIVKSITGKLKKVSDLFDPKSKLSKMLTKVSNAIKSITKSKWIAGLKKTFTTGWTKLTKVFKSVGSFFKSIIKLASKATGMTKILKWARVFGGTLGKLFLPITLLMSAWDLITGAISGWEKEGEKTDATFLTKFIAAIGGGLSKFVTNLVGIPLKWLTSGIAWIAGMLGFDEASTEISEFATKIPDFISNLVSAPFDFLKAGVKWLTNLFTSDDPVAELEKLWKKLVGAGNWIVNAIGTALDSVWEWFKGLFDIDFAAVAKAIVPDWAPDFIKEAVGLPVKKKTVAELEKELKAKEVSSGVNGTEAEQAELKKLREEIETLKRQNQAAAVGGGVNVKADTNIKNETQQLTEIRKTQPGGLILAVAGAGWE